MTPQLSTLCCIMKKEGKQKSVELEIACNCACMEDHKRSMLCWQAWQNWTAINKCGQIKWSLRWLAGPIRDYHVVNRCLVYCNTRQERPSNCWIKLD